MSSRRPDLRVGLRLLVVALAGALLGACELRTDLLVTVGADGGGTVRLGVGIDEETFDDDPAFFDDLAVDDLLAGGWEIDEPTADGSGFVWRSVSHEFDEPAELSMLVAEIAGADGPFRDFDLEIDESFTSTTYRFEGTVDFAGGAAAALEERTSGPADAVAPLTDQLRDALESLVRVRVGVRMPGEVTSNAPQGSTRASNGAVWQPAVLAEEPVILRATGTVRHGERWALIGLGVAIAFALMLFVLIRMALRRRSRLDDGTRLL